MFWLKALSKNLISLYLLLYMNNLCLSSKKVKSVGPINMVTDFE